MDVRSGKDVLQGRDLQGQSIAGKVFVFPIGKASAVDPNIAYAAHKIGNTAGAIIFNRGRTGHSHGCFMTDIAIIASFDQDPAETIRSGDYLGVGGNANTDGISSRE